MKNLFNNNFKNDTTRLYKSLYKHIAFLETEREKYQRYYNNNIDFITNNAFNDATIEHLINLIEKPIQIEIEKINQKIQNANRVISAIETIVEMYKQDIKYIEFNEYLNNILYGDNE